MSITIALDAMGGDYGPVVVVPAALAVLAKNKVVHIILVGNESKINSILNESKAKYDKSRLEVHNASQVVEMDEHPAQALRHKKDSSIRVALNLVKSGEAQACVSAGNTGALMATARFVLKMLPGIDRPAICKTLPTITGHTHVLDLGANIDSSAEQLFQFAVMASALSSAVDNKANPEVALLNIGEEDIKGNEQVKESAALLNKSNLNYIGYVEGNGIYLGHADVIVCDGFVGNVMLKASEGVAQLFSQFVKQEFKANLLTKIAALISMPVIKSFKKRVDPGEYNGASLLGLRKTVIKSHGGADAKSFETAIYEAIIEVDKNVPERIASQLETAFSGKEV
ncbi:MAG: phosphate acyltransferase PlsX [Thiohalomonadales bacterium]